MGVREEAQVQSDRDRLRVSGFREVDDLGLRLEVVADLSPQGGRADVGWTTPGRRVRAAYELEGGRLRWERDGVPGERDVPSDAVLSPLLRASQGWVIRRVAAVGEAVVVVPDIGDPHAPGLLLPLVGPRSAVLHDDGTASYEGDAYPPGTLFRLDADGVLLGYALGDVTVELVG